MRSAACLGAAVVMAACSQAATDGLASSAAKPIDVAMARHAPRADAPTLAHVHADLGELAGCRSELDCPAFDALVDLDTVAAPDVLAYVADRSHGNVRRLAAGVLGRIHDASAGPQLVALANVERDVMVQMDLLKAAGECGGAATFDALAGEYDREQPGAPGEHLVALRDGLRGFHDRALPWALAAVTRGGPGADKYADVLADVARPADRDTLVALIGATRNYHADDRLAAKALALGATDDKVYDTLLAGLASEDPGDRADAATLIRVVAPQLPALRRAKAVELIRRAMPHADPALASNLQASLARLGG